MKDRTSLTAICVGPAFWVVDSLARSFLFGGGSIVKQLFLPGPEELLLRLFVVMIMVIFGFLFQEHKRTLDGLKQGIPIPVQPDDNARENRLEAIEASLRAKEEQIKIAEESFSARVNFLNSQEESLRERQGKLESLELTLPGREKRLAAIESSLREKGEQSKIEEESLSARKNLLNERESALRIREERITSLESTAPEREKSLKETEVSLGEKEKSLKAKEDSLREREAQIKSVGTALYEKEEKLKSQEEALKVKVEQSLNEKGQRLKAVEEALKIKEEALKAKFENLKQEESSPKGREFPVTAEVQQQLLQSSKMAAVGQLASGAAFEINSSLSSIATNMQQVQELQAKGELNQPELKNILGKVEESVSRCKNISASLLGFSRLRADISERVSLTGIINRVTGLIENKARLQGIIIKKDFKPELPAIMGDQAFLQLAFFNLISRAKLSIQRKSLKDGGVISVVISHIPEDNLVCLSISDSGLEISQENIGHIFEPFFSNAQAIEAAGLDLSFVYNIIQDHKGAVTVESNEGQGTIFRITFPAAEESS